MGMELQCCSMGCCSGAQQYDACACSGLANACAPPPASRTPCPSLYLALGRTPGHLQYIPALMDLRPRRSFSYTAVTIQESYFGGQADDRGESLNRPGPHYRCPDPHYCCRPVSASLSLAPRLVVGHPQRCRTLKTLLSGSGSPGPRNAHFSTSSHPFRYITGTAGRISLCSSSAVRVLVMSAPYLTNSSTTLQMNSILVAFSHSSSLKPRNRLSMISRGEECCVPAIHNSNRPSGSAPHVRSSVRMSSLISSGFGSSKAHSSGVKSLLMLEPTHPSGSHCRLRGCHALST